ncbi:immunoglobulin domain-containing protein [Paenibacillus puerhi]|uniref:immunoglobulin domain-containing protein n=1 Tax=Paenibacillus puerhi TaxID=2692622 RepID=UPI0013587EAE|nr:immunoglobulin domain-containing protein [Paenibacillus puerhi]
MKLKQRFLVTAAILMMVVTVLNGTAIASEKEVVTGRVNGKAIESAVLQNFISDPVAGDNGLPTSPGAKMTRGINVGIDVDGNAIQAVDEQDLRYFDGKYYLYGQSFIDGAFHYAPGTQMTPVLPTKPAPSFYRYSGLSIYTSDDLMNWKLEKTAFLQDDETGEIYPVKKPRVVYSEKTRLYTMWFLVSPPIGWAGIPRGGDIFRYSQAPTPLGPWGPVHKPTVANDPTGNALGPDFEIVTGPDGTSWIVTSHNGVKVFKLNEEKTGTVEQIDLDIDFSVLGGGIGIHYNDDWWYITGSNGCGNCISAKFVYLMAKDPSGPWLSPETGSPELPLQPALLADNVESSQVHGAKLLPDSEGKLNVLIPATHYRSSPTGAPGETTSQPGDNSLALSGHFYFPLQYDERGSILPLDLKDSEEFPLAKKVVTTVPPTYEAHLSITNTKTIEQSWEVKASEPLASILPAVFQRTPDYSTRGLGQRDALLQEPFVDKPLLAELKLPDGTIYTWSIDQRTVAWAPTKIALNLPKTFTGKGRVTLKLSTTATNGGYGIAVGEKSYRVPGGEYVTIESGAKIVWPKAEILMQTSSELQSAPTITVQPKSLRVPEGSVVGFYVEAEGVGLGYQWTRDGKVIYAPDGYNESTGPTFRMQEVTEADSGTYMVHVFNQAGSVSSVPVTLEVIPAPDDEASAEELN